MKLIGILFLLFGWAIVIAAIALLHQALPQAAFIATGIVLQAAGLTLTARDYAHGQRNTA